MNLQVVTNFRVVDESADWIVVDKPAPLIVHPANHQAEPTLLGGISHLLAFEIANGERPAIVNRLDRDTSGLVLVAKTTAAARELGMIFQRREVRKRYLAIVSGWPGDDEWVCDAPILRAGQIGPSAVWMRQVVSEAGRECLTRFRVERRFERENEKFSVIGCFPETGRTHQIRVHLAHCGHPIVGDKLYSGQGAEYLAWMEDGMSPGLLARLRLPRHALHAASLGIPWRGRWCEWEVGLSRDLVDFLDGKNAAETRDVVIWNRAE
jgi:23S rRNA pseudouridine1911/1915/1917 synthase